MSNEGYHESNLSEETRDMHRAIVSLMEELEAVDRYNQRVDACKDKELRAILAHNRDEEKEHAAMVLEWIRRRDRGSTKSCAITCLPTNPLLPSKGSTSPEEHFMRTEAMQKLTRDQLMPLEQYAKQRNDFRAKVMAHKKDRQVQISPRARDLLLRGPVDHALPGAGNAACRAHLRRGGHRGSAQRL